jgi:cellobiose transport system permease protein
MALPVLRPVPLLIVSLFGARHFIRNIAAGAVKG